MGLKLRRITKYDKAHLLAMAQNMHAESPQYKDKTYSEAKVDLLIDMFLVSPLAAAWVAEKNGEVIGMYAAVVSEYFFGPDKYATDVVTYLRPEHRGSGAFKLMVEVAEAWAAVHGAKFYPSISFGANMDKTISSYERMGYEVCSYNLRKKVNG